MALELDASLIAEKSPLKMIIVGGTFDDQGGKASSYIAQTHAALPKGTVLVNGGAFSQISRIIEDLKDFDIILWFPNVPNDKEKLRDIKKLYPDKFLVTSKRNDADKYSLRDIAAHMLKLKSNLAVEFSGSAPFTMKLIDPLANTYETTKSPETMARAIMKRMAVIAGMRRQGTRKIDGESSVIVPDNPEFFHIIRDKAADFHRIVVSRPGTAPVDISDQEYFRCERGFPSIRDGDFIFVSKRDFASAEHFVSPKDMAPVNLSHFMTGGEIAFYGPNKPAVDTPIQMRLYAMFPKARFILHSHEHVQGAPFTSTVYAGETLQEVDEIVKVVGKDEDTVNVVVNLLGHGSVVLAGDLDYLRNVIYEARPLINEYTRMNGILVGGDFDAEGGNPSALIHGLQISLPENVAVRNGGTLRDLRAILDELVPYEIVMWFPRVQDGEDDVTRRIKQRYPFKTLIAGMFNPANDRSFQSIINKALGMRSNLFVEFCGEGAPTMRLYDPLSNRFADTDSPDTLAQAVLERLEALRRFSRQGSVSVGRAPAVPESQEFDRYVALVNLAEDELSDEALDILRQEFKAGRSEHYSRLLGMRWTSGAAMYRTMEDFFVRTKSVRFYRIMYQGWLAGRIVVNEDTGTLVDALVFAPDRGNHLGDVIIACLKEKFGAFNCIIPAGVPMFNFLTKRGLVVHHPEAVGPVDLTIMSLGGIEEERMKRVRELHAAIRDNYANALLNDFSTGETAPENSNLYRNFPEIYDLLYLRFSQRLGDYLKIVRDHTPDGGAILDAAAGTGEVSIPLLQAGYRVVSADLNSGMLEQLKTKAIALGVRPNTVVADFLSMGDLPNVFVSLNVRQAINYLIGFENLRRGFRSFRSALKDGGKLIFNAPNYDPAHFVPPVNGPKWIALNDARAIVWESNTINAEHVLTHHQKAIIWSAADRRTMRYYHDVNVFQMYTKAEFAQALADEGFSHIEVLSSGGAAYHPDDPAMYFIAETRHL
jgi:SAM-dependent methyltransferase